MAAGLLLFGELEQIFNLINTLECRVEKGEAKGGIRRKKVAARLLLGAAAFIMMSHCS